MNGASVMAAGYIGQADLSWKIVGIGNFDGAGKRDILWYNACLGHIGCLTVFKALRKGFLRGKITDFSHHFLT